MLSLLSLACIIGYDLTNKYIWNYAKSPTEIPGTLLNHIALSNSTLAKDAPMLAVKQPVFGRASNSTGGNYSSFQTNYNSCNTTTFATEDSTNSKCHLIKKGGKDLKWKSERFLPLQFRGYIFVSFAQI